MGILIGNVHQGPEEDFAWQERPSHLVPLHLVSGPIWFSIGLSRQSTNLHNYCNLDILFLDRDVPQQLVWGGRPHKISIFAQDEINVRWKTGDNDSVDNELNNLSKLTSVVADFGDDDDDKDEDEHQLEEMTTR